MKLWIKYLIWFLWLIWDLFPFDISFYFGAHTILQNDTIPKCAISNFSLPAMCLNLRPNDHSTKKCVGIFGSCQIGLQMEAGFWTMFNSPTQCWLAILTHLLKRPLRLEQWYGMSILSKGVSAKDIRKVTKKWNELRRQCT